ncbi:MAG: DUF1634 domain-containing protein [Candidatus Zixiibacteriota bacterium]|nr:MAG: DUF1634 domain-containing protein [candidate division Zixibacteria bacterium]
MRDKKEKTLSYVSTILLIGSFCAAGLLVLGLGLSFFQTQPQADITASPGFSLSKSIGSLLRGEPTAVINLGILVMMLTPFLRVVVAAFSFLLEKDLTYASVAFGVMLILLFTMLPTLF